MQENLDCDEGSATACRSLTAVIQCVAWKGIAGLVPGCEVGVVVCVGVPEKISKYGRTN